MSQFLMKLNCSDVIGNNITYLASSISGIAVICYEYSRVTRILVPEEPLNWPGTL